MGRSGLSSRKKHSKKKRLKVSSEARQKKRRYKSKKLHRHDDSFPSCSDDESTSSSLVSSSSSEGEYKSRRSRPRIRNEVKGSRKRTRRSLSEERSKDPHPVKKRKGSKKKSDSEKKKKNKKIKKKKSRRTAYISSASSDSASCSTCREGDSSSDEGASHRRPRGRSRDKKKNPRDSIKGRKTRSSSPSKLSDSYDNESIEKAVMENHSRRLKSVITVAKQPEDEEENNKRNDELKEEIVYDYDDYPSCKSNDSNDGEIKKELVDHSNISPEKRNEFTGSKEKDSNASGNIGSEVDNLESILRQKALENLSRFRDGLQTKVVANDQSASVDLGQPVIPRSRFTWRRDPSVTTGKEEKAATYNSTDSGKSQAPARKLDSAKSTHDSQKSTPSVETPSKEKQTETSDNSQFEKKTMSVMRGGEMVQVSYKVYIPNRAPALARRQLNR